MSDIKKELPTIVNVEIHDNIKFVYLSDFQTFTRRYQEEITRLTALVAKYEAAIDKHKRALEFSKWSVRPDDFKLWQTREG